MSNHEKLFEKIMGSKEILQKIADAGPLRDQVEMILELGMEHNLPVDRQRGARIFQPGTLGR